MKNFLPTAAVITVSDKSFKGEREDTSGPMLRDLLKEDGFEIIYSATVPDEAELIKAELIKCSDELRVQLVLTTGGTGFSKRDVTPEAVCAVIERPTPGIPEAMRAESMKITPRGCLSRSVAGIRKDTLIVTLPGSAKAARENILAVLEGLRHGIDMLMSFGSADCAQQSKLVSKAPSVELWMREADALPDAPKCGEYLLHRGIVRASARAQVREGKPSAAVCALELSYDASKLAAAEERVRAMDGIYLVRSWVNSGTLKVGDEMMLVLVAGDTRSHVMPALSSLIDEIKSSCVCEREIFA